MATSKEMEDWFLRGGKRPEMNGMQQVSHNLVCQNCGGENVPDEEYCTHCGAALTGGTSTGEYCGDDEEERDFIVTLTRTKTIRQKTTMRVSATTANEAMDRAEDEVSDFDGDWEDVPGSEEYEDCEADDAEEAD